MAALIIVEHYHQRMHPAMRHVLTVAKLLGEKPVLLVIGYHCQAVAQEAACLAGVDKVLLADHACYEHQLPENTASLIVELSSSFDAILVSSSTFGKNILPRVAAQLDMTQVSDVTRIIDANTFEHPIYAGNAIETIQVLDDKKLLSIRETAFSAEVGAQTPCAIEAISTVIPLDNSAWVSSQLNVTERPELTQADVIISGGRGLQNKENFHLIEQLADVLGAAVGASRAAVDAGFVPNDYQVGQTGKVVAPQLYIAIGISGAVQHLAGMKDSKIIVAINKDADAPIMQMATYALVGDLFDLVPQLIEQLKRIA